ncbi:PREDICTED: homeobox protein CDX-2-like [Nipponia nippon]|uniref:homeobox protein CDX-2-like n=1 Tax=Nipponia nippon TaxID=128390 RepID=UPI00051107FE|nr:PREDICTED: homeobox protein CDX-2-like [Nipponia nippon]
MQGRRDETDGSSCPQCPGTQCLAPGERPPRDPSCPWHPHHHSYPHPRHPSCPQPPPINLPVPRNAASKQARKRFCLKLRALDRDGGEKKTTKEHQPKLNHRLHHRQSQLLPFLQLGSSPRQDEDVTVPCAAASREMASIAEASGSQHRQMKVRRKRRQPPFEEALLKPQRQEDAGMVVRDLLPQLWSQLHWHAPEWELPLALPPPPCSHPQRKPSSAPSTREGKL